MNMGYLTLAKPKDSDGWTFGKWFATHGEAQFYIHTIPCDKYLYKIVEINDDILKENTSCSIQEDDDIPSEVVIPQCNLDDEECESCQ